MSDRAAGEDARPAKTDWEETSRPNRDTLEDYVSRLDWECLRLQLIKSYYREQELRVSQFFFIIILI